MLAKLIRPRLLVVALLVASSAALAGEPTAADRATARKLMLEGRNLRHDKDLKGALEKFRAADALMEVPTTGIELARTQAELGLLVEALDTCARVIRHPESPGEPAPFRVARSNARDLRAELQRRTPVLRFVLADEQNSSDAELRVDGVAIPPEAHNTPRLVNPGKHDVALSAGPHRQLVTVVVREGEARDVAFTLPQRDRTEQRAKQRPVHDDEPNPWVWGGFTTAAVGGAVGGVAGVLAWTERNRLDDACPNRTCPAGEMDRVDRAYLYANVSTYAFIAGGIGAAVGIGALWSSKRDEEDTDVSVRVIPCSEGTLCLDGRF